MLYYVDTTIFNGLEALLLTHSNLQLRSCHQVTLHDIYDRWRTITMARRSDSFNDLSKSMGKLGISNGDDKKKKINNEDDDWSMGTKIALGVGAGVALGAGIAALSYFLGGSDDQKEEETKRLPGRSQLYVADDLDDNDHGDHHVDHTLQFQSPQGSFDSAQVTRRYGYFQCSNCRHHWESVYTYSKGRLLNDVRQIILKFYIFWVPLATSNSACCKRDSVMSNSLEQWSFC